MNQYNEQERRHGPWEKYFHTGQLFYRCSYDNGNLHGPYEVFHSNGQLAFRGTYDQGEPRGRCEKFDMKGVLQESRFIKEGDDQEQE